MSIQAGRLVPAYLSGELGGTGAEPGRRLAVAVNGRVAAVTRSYREDEQTRVDALVPPQAFREGRNDVQYFVISGEGADRRFARLDRPGGSGYRLVSRDGVEYVATPSGKRIAVRPGAAAGYMEHVNRDGVRIVIAGWAGDVERERPVRRVLVFGDGRLLAAGKTTLWRPDVARNHGLGLAHSGYRLTTASEDAAAIVRPGHLRAFALSRRGASELMPHSAATWPGGEGG
jgi:hypothetical protein